MNFAQTITDNGKTYKESVISLDYRKTHGILVEDATDPQQAPAYRQLTTGLTSEARAREAAIAEVEAARAALERALTAQLEAETQARINGDQLAESRLQQAIEGVSKRTVAARYDGVGAPTLADVPGIDAAAPADDWRSWFLWDQGAGNPNTGIYSFAGATPVRVDTITLEAGLLVFVNSGTFADTQWLMIDDPVGGVADFVPWQRVSDFSVTGPLYKENNIVRLAFEAQYLTTRVNPDTGEIELTISQAFRDRLSTAESNITGLRTDVGTLQGDVVGLRTDVDRHTDEISALQQSDRNQNDQIQGLVQVNTDQTQRLTELERTQPLQDAAITALQQADTAFDDRLTNDENRLQTVEQDNQAQAQQITGLQNSDRTINGRIDTLTGRIEELEFTQPLQDAAIADLEQADTAFDNRLRTVETDNQTQAQQISTLQTTKVDQAAVDTSITAYDRATRIIRPFTVTNTVQQGNVYVHTLECATGLGTTDFVMAEARFVGGTPLRRLDTPPEYVIPATCRILVEGTAPTIAAGAVEGFFERFHR